jgi:putative PIN family toxin of toxin-antitoxin system
LRVVLDTNVIVSGLLTPQGAPGQLLRLHAEGAFDLVVSPSLLEELFDVLERPHVMLLHERDLILDHLRSEATIVVDKAARHPTIPTDPDDVFLLDLAVNSAAILVTGDRALQRLAATALVLSPRALVEALSPDPQNFEDAPRGMVGLHGVPAVIDRARQTTLREVAN